MIDIELFPKVNDRLEHSVQGLDRLLNWMTTNEKLKTKTKLYKQWLYENPNATPKEKSAMKVYYFPAVTFAGTFSGTGTVDDITKMSGLIVLDFDHIQNLTEVKQKLQNDDHTFLLFTSPSGDGLKLVVKHDLEDPLKWKYLYFEFESYYLNTFGLITDKSGKDICRMCFLPFIENLYRNESSIIWKYSGVYERQNTSKTTKAIMQPDTTEMTDDLFKECYYISAYLFENKINISENYEDWVS
jgi:hypothetical protein